MLKLKLQHFGHLMQSPLIGKDPDAGKDRGQEEKWAAEDEMVGQHHQLSGHESEQTPGDGGGQGSLAGYSRWGQEEFEQDLATRQQKQQMSRPSPYNFIPSQLMLPVLPSVHINVILHSFIRKLSKVAFQVANPFPGYTRMENLVIPVHPLWMQHHIQPVLYSEGLKCCPKKTPTPFYNTVSPLHTNKFHSESVRKLNSFISPTKLAQVPN